MIVVDQVQGLRKDADRYWTLENVKEAVRMLAKIEGFETIIPEGGTNIGMAIAGAESEKDVAAVDGRIVPTKEGVNAGCVDFGVSSHVARLILAMMAQDKECRSAINVKYTPEILLACKEAGLQIASFERDKEPADVKTMEWGVREAVRNLSLERKALPKEKVELPDVIFDLGAVGKEPMVRIFGDTAVEVAEKVKSILEYLEQR